MTERILAAIRLGNTQLSLVRRQSPAPARTSGVIVVRREDLARANALSPSQVETFLRCEALWYYKHALQLPDSKSAASAIGFAIHDVIANTLRAKHEDGELPPLETAMEFYNDHASTLLVDALQKPGANADAEREAGSGAFRQWYRGYAQHVQVATDEHGPLIERSMAGRIAGILVNTVIDLVDRIRGVVDWKSAGRRPTGISNHARFQLTTYCATARQTHGELVTITKTKTPMVYPMHFTPTWADVKYAENIYPQVALASRSGLYPPRRGNFLCSRSRCAYWRECEEEHGGRVTD